MARTEKREMHAGKSEGKTPLRGAGRRVRIILKWLRRKSDGRRGFDLSLRIETNGGVL